MRSSLPILQDKRRPGEDVMNFFNKKTHGMVGQIQPKGSDDEDEIKINKEKLQVSQNNQNGETTVGNQSAHQPQFTARQKESTLSLEEDEDKSKEQKLTDFALKLTELKDRIEVYEKLFLTRQPKFLHRKNQKLKTVGAQRKQSQNSSQNQSPEADDILHPMPHKRPARPRLTNINQGHKSMINFLPGMENQNQNFDDQQLQGKIRKHSESLGSNAIHDIRKQNTNISYAGGPQHMSKLQMNTLSTDTMGTSNHMRQKSTLISPNELPQIENEDKKYFMNKDRGNLKNHKLSHYALINNKEKMLKEQQQQSQIKSYYIKKTEETDISKQQERRKIQESTFHKVLKTNMTNSKSTPQLKIVAQSQALTNVNSQSNLQGNAQNQNSSSQYHLPQVNQKQISTNEIQTLSNGQIGLGSKQTSVRQIIDSQPRKKFLKKSFHQHPNQPIQHLYKLEISQDQIKPKIRETTLGSKKNSQSKIKITDSHQHMILNRPEVTRNYNPDRSKGTNSPSNKLLTSASQKHLEKVYMKKNETFLIPTKEAIQENSKKKINKKKDRSMTNTILENVLKEPNNQQQTINEQDEGSQSHKNQDLSKINSNIQLPEISKNQSSQSLQPDLIKQDFIQHQIQSQTIYNESEKVQGRKIKQIQKEEEMRTSHSPFKQQQKLKELLDTYNNSRVQKNGGKSKDKKSLNQSKINKSVLESKKKSKKIAGSQIPENLNNLEPQPEKKNNEQNEGQPEVQLYSDDQFEEERHSNKKEETTI